MKKIHCLYNSISFCLNNKFDIRPLFFGLWDLPDNIIEKNELRYYSKTNNFNLIINNFKTLYIDGLTILLSIMDYKNVDRAYEKLKFISQNKLINQHLILLLDIFYLPYEKKCYKKLHLPHYIVINYDKIWHINDEYISWHGEIEENLFKEAFYNSMLNSRLTGCFLLDEDKIVPNILNFNTIKNYYYEIFYCNKVTLIDEVRSVIQNLFEKNMIINEKILSDLIFQIDILSSRKYSYEFAFSFFYDILKKNSEKDLENVEKLVNNWFQLLFLISKLFLKPSYSLYENIIKKLNSLLMLEKKIKENLREVFNEWQLIILKDN